MNMNRYSVKGQTGPNHFNFLIVNAESEKSAWEISVRLARGVYKNWVVVGVEKL